MMAFLTSILNEVRISATPIFFYAVILILVLERLFPVNPNQKIFNVSFAQDFFWFFLDCAAQAVLIVSYVAILRGFYRKHLSFLTVSWIGELPGWARFFWAVLVIDFLKWYQHVLHHKIPWLWQFHKIHHSQQSLNLFTDSRYHFVEYLVKQSVVVIPMMILTVNTPLVIAYKVLIIWHSRFYHANVKTNLGFLRYFISNPQSHRIHHSKESRHYDKNFGALFVLWDMIFGTQCWSFDEYPETGLKREEMPEESSLRGMKLLFMPLIQLVTPFQMILQGFMPKQNIPEAQEL